MIEIRTGRCSRREVPARNGRVGVHPVTLDRAWHRPRPARLRSAPPSEIMVGADLQDQLAPIGMQAEAHDVVETRAPAARGAAPGARRHRRGARVAGAVQVGPVVRSAAAAAAS